MTGTPGGVGVAGGVLVVVLVLGILAGRAKRRWTYLLTGLAAVVVLGIAVTAVAGVPGDDPATEVTALYSTTVPLIVGYLAGWLCGRGTWFRRLVVIAVAALLLAVFPYAAAGAATAGLLPPR
ncbi:hypothetical protein [Pseudonocardia sp. TRM90224]|uniref:hypothetical protein n=1 Tax=Pseudonocardia sp. TRM90224 TaxID=2812678 RepID=UPI001E30608C|nr:hypothetical protein [Pseudonocardia sp. TRM90224]